ncbi:ATP-dependent DNA helicase PIF1-like protein [Tanacetum coccineum]
MTVNKRICATFKEACFAYRLLEDDKEWTRSKFVGIRATTSRPVRDHFIVMQRGTDKTFLYKTIILRLRLKRKIVLAIASSEIASFLLPRRRTAHSRFIIPLELLENSSCGIKQNTNLAELMQEVQLIIWDEALMTQKYAFEALDKTLRDILGYPALEKQNKIFGDITMLLGGDYKLPAKIKDGEDKPTWIEIPEKFLINSSNLPIKLIVAKTYPNFIKRQMDDAYLKERAILTPRNDDTDAINAYIFDKLEGESVTYNSAYEICKH